MFLQQLSDHENIVRLMNVLKADNDRDIYLVFDFMGRLIVQLVHSQGDCESHTASHWDMKRPGRCNIPGLHRDAIPECQPFPCGSSETDLHAVIRAQILEPIHKQYIIYQLLRAIKYMHSGGADSYMPNSDQVGVETEFVS